MLRRKTFLLNPKNTARYWWLKQVFQLLYRHWYVLQRGYILHHKYVLSHCFSYKCFIIGLLVTIAYRLPLIMFQSQDLFKISSGTRIKVYYDYHLFKLQYFQNAAQFIMIRLIVLPYQFSLLNHKISFLVSSKKVLNVM